MSDESYKPKSAEIERTEFLTSDVYKSIIEPYLGQQTSAIDKIIFGCEFYYNDFKDHAKLFVKGNFAYNKELAESLEDELGVRIKTPQDLDSFLSELESKYNSILEQRGESKIFDSGHYVGDRFAHTMVEVFQTLYIGPHNNGEEATEDDMDWLYALMRHLYGWTDIIDAVRNVYKKNISNPKSVALREELISKGVNFDLRIS